MLHTVGTRNSSQDSQDRQSRQHKQLELLVALLLIACFGAWLLTIPQPAKASQHSAPDMIPDAPSIMSLNATPTCVPSWSVVNSPNPGTSTNYLQGVAAISPNDIWVVGSYDQGSGSRTLTLHWDGTQWTHVPSPSPGTSADGFGDIVAISSNDIWAVGVTHNTGGAWWTLIEHWNGTQWSVVPSPNLGSTQYLYGVSAVSSNDVWAVGYYINSGGYAQTLAQHWNGTQWSVVPTPNLGNTSNNQLFSISAISTNDVWAVGYYIGGALIEHWNGVQWSVVPNPNPAGAYISNLYGVSALSSNDVWAVGRWADNTHPYDRTLIKHWNGTQWSVVPSPDVGGTANSLWSVSAISSTDVWAVGYACCGPSSVTLAEHWDGAQWSVVDSLNPGTGPNLFDSIVAVSPDDVWVVGYYQPCFGCSDRTLIEHYAPTDTCLPPTPSPTNTTVPISTPTSTSSTSTPTMTITTIPTAQPILVGHVNWEARPAQPNQLHIRPVTLTLRTDSIEMEYPAQLTDQYGFFTVTLGSLPNGTYAWRADDTPSEHLPANYLANSGVVDIDIGGASTSIEIEMGLMRTGDANNNNQVNVSDFNMLKVSFGAGCGYPAYDNRTDFSGDCLININDFTPLKRNFGQGGAPPIEPGLP